MPANLTRTALFGLAATLLTATALLLLLVAAPGRAALPAVAAAAVPDGTVGASPAFTVNVPIVFFESPAILISAAGHGLLFYRDRQTRTLSPALVQEMQEAILTELAREGSQGQLPPDEQSAIADAQALLKLPATSVDEGVYLRGAIIDRIVSVSSAALRSQYDWRSSAIVTAWIGGRVNWQTLINPEVLAILKRLRFLPPLPDTDYMARCRALGVPIPPDWAATGTAWELQGTLGTNILGPGSYAGVYTYNDPAVDGACIALPRRNAEGDDTVAGIICQSANTGHACFWDNRLRNNPGVVMGWEGLTLEIDQLVDGSNLRENCTACHVGNNVYLISPDDATWGRVLRGPLLGSVGGFTTRVLNSSDTSLGHPRYIPVTTDPPRDGWVNRASSAPSCAGACHEMVSPEVLTLWPPPSATPAARMPPACAAGGVENCYGTP
jgi:hypothetical protein